MIKRFGVSLPKELLDKLDQLTKKKGYEHRSEAIRDLIRDRFRAAGSQEVVGTVTLVYDHHPHDLSDKLTDLQHTYYQNIVSSTHIHLDEHHCLEVLVIRGPGEQVKEIADRLISAKGVKHGKLVTIPTGRSI